LVNASLKLTQATVRCKCVRKEGRRCFVVRAEVAASFQITSIDLIDFRLFVNDNFRRRCRSLDDARWRHRRRRRFDAVDDDFRQRWKWRTQVAKMY